VVSSRDATRALRAVHSAFWLSSLELSIGIVGTGRVGSALLQTLLENLDILEQRLGLKVKIRGVANSRKMLLAEDLSVSLRDVMSYFDTDQYAGLPTYSSCGAPAAGGDGGGGGGGGGNTAAYAYCSPARPVKPATTTTTTATTATTTTAHSLPSSQSNSSLKAATISTSNSWNNLYSGSGSGSGSGGGIGGISRRSRSNSRVSFDYTDVDKALLTKRLTQAVATATGAANEDPQQQLQLEEKHLTAENSDFLMEDWSHTEYLSPLAGDDQELQNQQQQQQRSALCSGGLESETVRVPDKTNKDKDRDKDNAGIKKSCSSRSLQDLQLAMSDCGDDKMDTDLAVFLAHVKAGPTPHTGSFLTLLHVFTHVCSNS
jgi:hypothetical protein